MLKFNKMLKIFTLKLVNTYKYFIKSINISKEDRKNNFYINKFKSLFSSQLFKSSIFRISVITSVLILFILGVTYKTVDINQDNKLLTTSLVTNTNSYEVYYNEELLGIISDADIVGSATQYALMELNLKYNEVYAIPEPLKIVKSHHKKDEIIDTDQFKQNLLSTLDRNVGDLLVQAYVVEVENGTTVTLNELEEVKEALTLVTSRYVPEDEQFQVTSVDVNSYDEENITLAKVNENTVTLMAMAEPKTARTSSFTLSDDMSPQLEPTDNESSENEEDKDDVQVKSVKLADKVTVNTEFVKQEELVTVGQAVETLTDYEKEQVVYVVKSGDTLSQIAYDHNMTMDELEKFNPGISKREKCIQIGEEIIITRPDPNLSVETIEVVCYEEPINREVIYEYDNTQYTTYSRVKEKGSDGLKEVIAEVKKINGIEEEKSVVEEVVLAEPVPKVIVRGTLTPPQFIPPINGGTITSYFGPRWGGHHQGIDIAAPRGTDIHASASGYVIYAGWYGGYGNLVIVDHRNGYKTYYAHNSAIYVSVGEYVNQGEVIAAVGSTGDSTGNHVHFELRHYDTPINPYSYIY